MNAIKDSLEIKNLLEILKNSIDPDKVILFGSRATNNFSIDSDYDICIIKKNVNHKRKLAQAVYKSLFGSGLSVDVIVETPEMFIELQQNPYLIYQQIYKKGIVIYEKY